MRAVRTRHVVATLVLLDERVAARARQHALGRLPHPHAELPRVVLLARRQQRVALSAAATEGSVTVPAHHTPREQPAARVLRSKDDCVAGRVRTEEGVVVALHYPSPGERGVLHEQLRVRPAEVCGHLLGREQLGAGGVGARAADEPGRGELPALDRDFNITFRAVFAVCVLVLFAVAARKMQSFYFSCKDDGKIVRLAHMTAVASCPLRRWVSIFLQWSCQSGCGTIRNIPSRERDGATQ